jgi:hypothetical protein
MWAKSEHISPTLGPSQLKEPDGTLSFLHCALSRNRLILQLVTSD